MLKTARLPKFKEKDLINHVDYYVERVKEIPVGERYDYFVSNYVLKDELQVLQDFKESDRDWKDTEFKVRRQKWYDFVRQNFVEKRIDFKCIGHWHSWVLNPSFENEVNEFFDLNYVMENPCVLEKLSRLYFDLNLKVVSKVRGRGCVLVTDYVGHFIDGELMAHGYLPYRMTYEQFLEVRVAEKTFLSKALGYDVSGFKGTKTVKEKNEKRDDSKVLEVKGFVKDHGRQRSGGEKSAVKRKVSPVGSNKQGGRILLQELEINEVVESILCHANTEFELWSEEEIEELANAYPEEEVAIILTSSENPCCGKAFLLDFEVKEAGLTAELKEGKEKSEEDKSGTGDPALKLVGYVSSLRLLSINKRKEEVLEEKEKSGYRGFWRWNLSRRKAVLKGISRMDEFPILVKDVRDKPRCHLGNQLKRLLLSRRVCVLL